MQKYNLIFKNLEKNIYKLVYFVSGVVAFLLLKYYFDTFKISTNLFFYLSFLLLYISVYFYIKWNKVKIVIEHKSLLIDIALIVILTILFLLCCKYFHLKKGIIYLIFLLLFFVVLFYFFSRHSGKDDFIIREQIFYKTDLPRILITGFLFILFLIIGQYFALKYKKILAFVFFTLSIIILFFVFEKNKIKTNKCKITEPKYDEKDKFVKFIMLSFAMPLFLLSYYYLEIDNIKIFLISFLVATFSLGVAAKNMQFYKCDKYSKIEIFQILTFFIFALFLRIYKLEDFPPGLIPDEMASVNYVIFIARAINKLNLSFIYDFIYIPSFHFELMGNILKLLKINLFNLRLFYAVLGAFVIVFIYIISKELFDKRVALISSLFYFFMLPAILYSRIAALTWSFPVFYITGMVAFFILAVKYNKIIYYILTSIFCGLSIYCYHTGKFSIVILFILFLLFIFLYNKKNNIYDMKIWVLILLSLFVIIFPTIYYLLQHKNNISMYLARMNNQSIFNFNESKNLNFLFVNLTAYLVYLFKFFINNGIICSHVSYFLIYSPAIDKITSFFMLVGIGFCLFNIKNTGEQIIITCFIVSFFPHLFSIAPPAEGFAMSRMLILFPFISIMAGIGFVTLIKIIMILSKKLNVFIYIIIIFILFSLVVQENFNKFITTINEPTASFSVLSPLKKMFEYISKKENHKRIIFSNYFVGSKGNWFYPLSRDYNINLDKIIYKLGNMDLSEIYNDEKKDVLLILDGSYNYMDDLYKSIFSDVNKKIFWNYYFWLNNTNNTIKYCYDWKTPDKTIKSLPYKNFQINSDNEPYVNFVLYDIPYKDIDELFSMTEYKYLNNKLIKKEKIKDYKFNKYDYADKIIIRGFFYAPVYGQYVFFTKDNKMETYIDWKKYNANEYISEGLHTISFVKEIKDDSEEQFIYWINPFSKKEEKIPAKYFYSKGHKNNIEVKYFDRDKKLIYKEKVAKIDMTYSGSEYYLFKNILKNNICVETVWDTKIFIKDAGEYNFAIETIYDTDLYVDNKIVFVKRLHSTEENSIVLTKGIHNIKVKSSMCPGPYSTFRFVMKKKGDFRYKPVSYYDYR